MGKTGKLYSSTVVCSPTSFTQDTSNSFVVHGSGLSVDVAAAAVAAAQAALVATWDDAARQGLVATQLAEQSARVALYKALGGGWRSDSVAQR